MKQCQAMAVPDPKYDLQGKRLSLPKYQRCEQPGIINDPRGPCFCWVHHKAFNNPVRSTPLRLHKSVTE